MSSENFDIVHSHIGLTSGIYLWIAKECGINHRISHSHATNVEKYNFLYNIKNKILKMMVTKYSTNLFACSNMAGRFMFNNNDFTLINNAIEVSKYSFNKGLRKKIRADFNIKQDEMIIGHVGRFAPQKNHEFLINIFSEYLKLDYNGKLCLLGEGPLYEKIKNIVDQSRFKDKVLFIGTVNNTEEYYQMFDCLVLPSLFEGLPVVGIEAQAAGLPCFFSNEITKEVSITENCTFLSIKNDNAKEWAQKIYDLKKKKKMREKNDQSIIKHGYSIDEEVNKLVALYEKIINE